MSFSLGAPGKGRNRVTGWLLSPDRRITLTPLNLIGRVLWAAKADERGTPAWISPKTMRLVDGEPAVMLTTVRLIPVVGPEDPPIEAPASLITRMFGERQSMLAGAEAPKLNKVPTNNWIAMVLAVMNAIVFTIVFYSKISDGISGIVGGGV